MSASCSRTLAVLALLDSLDDPDAELANHAAECPVCREAMSLESGELPLAGPMPLAEEPNPDFLARLSGAVSGRTHVPADPLTERLDLPGFEIFEEIGRGGTATVFRARQVYLNRIVALKVLRNDRMLGPHDLIRARRGSSAVASIRHPNVIQIYEIGRKGGEFYAALEFAEGGSLASRLTGEPWEPIEAAKFVIALAQGVAAVHAAGFVHRDLKPGNVLLDANRMPKVADFGLARSITGEDAITSGTFIGTPAAMAPEQIAGVAVGPRADVHALGGILYELLTGHAPFRAGSSAEAIHRVQSETPPPPSSIVKTVPLSLDRVCLWCLAKNPAERCPSAIAMVNALTAAMSPRARNWRSWLMPVLKWAGIAVLSGFVVSGWYHSSQARKTAEATHDFVRLSAASQCLANEDHTGAYLHLLAIPESRRTEEWKQLERRVEP